MISNSLDIDFIHSTIHGWMCKKYIYQNMYLDTSHSKLKGIVHNIIFLLVFFILSIWLLFAQLILQ